MIRTVAVAAAMALAALGAPRAAAADHTLAAPLCRALTAAVGSEAAGSGPAFLASYRPGPDETAVPLPLRSSAFSYDNALAAIALVSCGDVASARRIADGFLLALDHDRTFRDGRVRNAYRAGGVAPVVLLPGWWEPSTKSWAEDSYQVGTATGNVAWAALALLTIGDATKNDPRYLAGTRSLLNWVASHAQEPGLAGVTGGLDGYDSAQTRLPWKSSEHNVDVFAAALWYGQASRTSAFASLATSSRRFLDEAFLPGPGCFAMGTNPDGKMNDGGHLALDTQLWPLFGIADAPAAWRRALACAETRMGVAGGFDFDDDRDGLWVEGTAQAAFTYRALGRPDRANQLLDGLAARDVSGSGWLYATRESRLTTGLKIGPQSVENDFFYFRRPHLGATAWAVLAATGWNPFTGRRVD